MSAAGYYRMQRGWIEHPVLSTEPHNRRSAWVWLVENAAWQDTTVDVRGTLVVVRRGQLSRSNRALATAWKWQIGQVQRFLTRLQTESMVEVQSDSGRMLITLCNYDRYQAAARGTDSLDDTASDTPPIRQRYASDTQKKEVKKDKKRKKEEDPSGLGQNAPANAALSQPIPRQPTMPGGVLMDAVGAWNEVAARRGLSQVRHLSDTRRRALAQRLQECGGMDGWRHAMSLVDGSAFLTGRNDRGWMASFDFIIRRDKFTRLMEGDYRASTKPAPSNLDWMAKKLDPDAGVILENEP